MVTATTIMDMKKKLGKMSRCHALKCPTFTLSATLLVFNFFSLCLMTLFLSPLRGTPAASTPAARQAKRNRVTEYMDEMDELMPSMPMIKYRVRQMFPMDVTLELEQPRNGGKRRLEQNKRRWTLKMEGACRLVIELYKA